MHSRIVGAGALVLVIASAGLGRGDAAKTPAVDPDAMAALDRMGAELRSHSTFSLKSDVTNEDVLGDGQKLQYQGTVQIQARRPDRFRISMVSDQRDREFYYDGKVVTVYSPRLGYYAKFDAPSTIRDTLARANEKFGIEFPLSTFHLGHRREAGGAGEVGLSWCGQERIEGGCAIPAFRRERVDWQVWIQQDGPALPCKLVITNRTDPGLPQYTAVMHWSTPDTIADNVFAFVPPADSHRIIIASLELPKGATP